MRVIPVLDVAGGVAVHARGGARHRYAPVRSVLTSLAANPLALARAYHDHLGTDEVYVADLDAIAGGTPNESVQVLRASGSRVWLDAGVGDVSRASEMVTGDAVVAVIGLETLSSRADLERIARALPVGRWAFSLDLRDGVPVVRGSADLPRDVRALGELAAKLAIRRLIVLDLARVGSGRGADLELLRTMRVTLPEVELVAGGGVRDAGDLESLRAVGCDAALVATALHEGRLTPEEIRAAAGMGGHG